MKQSAEHIARRIESRRNNGSPWQPSGFTPWNKGQTKYTNEKVAKYADSMRKGRKLHNEGYWLIYVSDHPRSDRGGYIFEHIVIAEKKLGRYLYAHEETHHINGNKQDNREENIAILTKARHTSLHMKGKHPHSTRLTDNQVAEIRASELSRKELAKLYGMSYWTICDIKSRRYWN